MNSTKDVLDDTRQRKNTSHIKYQDDIIKYTPLHFNIKTAMIREKHIKSEN